MKYLLKVKSAITLLPFLIAVSYLPTYAQNTAPVPTTFEILSPSDGTLPFLINHDYAGNKVTANTRIFYGGDFARLPNNAGIDYQSGFLGWQPDAAETAPDQKDDVVARGNATYSRLTLGGTEKNDHPNNLVDSKVVNLPGDYTLNGSFDPDDIGDYGAAAWTISFPDYRGSNGFIAINEEDSLVIRLTGYVDPNNRLKYYPPGGPGASDDILLGFGFESNEYVFDIANPANDSQNGVRFGVVPSTLPAGASFNGAIFSWVPNFIQGDGDFDNSDRNGRFFVDANISNGLTSSELLDAKADTSGPTRTGVGRGSGELLDSLYVVYFTAMDDGIPPKVGVDSLFIMVNDSIANPPPVFTKREVVDPSGSVQNYFKSSVQFTTDSLLAYSEGDSIVITFNATDQDSARGGGSNQTLDFQVRDWSDFLHRDYSSLDSLALDTVTVVENGVRKALKVRLQVAYNVADTVSADTVKLVVWVRDETNPEVYDTMLFDIANINRPPIWDVDTTSKPSDSAFVYAYDPVALYPDSIEEFTPIAVANGVTDSIYLNQYVYDPDPLIGDSLGPALIFSTTSTLADVFPGDGLVVVTLFSPDTASFVFPVVVTDSDPNEPKESSKNLLLRVAPEPDIAEIHPPSGYPGQDITIFGEGFGLYDINSSTPSRVIFRARNIAGLAMNLQATINSWGKDRINLTIPSQVPVSRYTPPPTPTVIPDTIQVYSAVFSTPTVYPYVITEPDTTVVYNLEAVNITSTSAKIKWKTAFTGTDSVIVATANDTLDVFTPDAVLTGFPDGTGAYWPTFVIPDPVTGNLTSTKSTVQVFRGATSTTDEVHYVELTNLVPGVTYQLIIAMENKLFFGDTTRDINGPYNPVKIDRSNLAVAPITPEVNAAIRGFLLQTLPAQNAQGETYAIQGNVVTKTGMPAIGALVTVRVVDADNVADTSLPLTATVVSDSAWVINLGDAVTDTVGMVDRTFVHEAGDFLIITIEGDKDIGFVQFVTTRGTSSPQAVNLGENVTQLVPSVNYDLRLKVGLNLIGIPVDLFTTEPQTAKALLSEITQGIPSISRWISATGTQETITRTGAGFVGANDWNLADEDGNYYCGYFIAVDGQEYITLGGSLYGTELPPVIFDNAALYWIARPAQIDSLFYAWSARTMLANIANASEIFRYNEDTQQYESACVDQVTGSIVYNNNFHIDVSEGYILRVTAASQWDINTPTLTQLANAEAKFGSVSGVTPSLTLNTSESNASSGAVRNVRLSDITSSAAVVSWITNGSVTTQIRYGKASEGLNRVAVFTKDANSVACMGSLQLLGLEPETEYVFEIVSNGITYNNNGGPYIFKTAKIGTGFPYTVYGRMVDESGEPLENTMVYVELRRGDKPSTTIADLTDENGYWNVNLANLKMADGEVYQWKAGDEIRVTAVYSNVSMSFRTLVTGESPQNVVRVSDLDGVASKKEVAKVALPKAFALGQNYPNPFNPSTTIAYDIPDSEVHGLKVDLNIYNIRGQLVRKLVSAVKEPGHYVVQWSGENNKGEAVSSGVYFYRIKAGNFVSTRKMVLLK